MKTIHASIVMLFAILQSPIHAQTTDHNEKTENKEIMTITQNKEVIRKLYEESLNKRDMKLLPQLISNEYTGIRGRKGAAAFEEPIALLITAFPDIQWNVQQLIGEGDKVVIKWKWQGTSTAPFQQLAATSKIISNDGIAIFELKESKIISSQIHTDRLGFLQEMEALPANVALITNKKEGGEQVRFIDKFLVPAKTTQEFMERVTINRNFIKNLPGFIEDAAYARTDEKGNLIYITIATWQNEAAMKQAKEMVQAEYKKQGFDAAAMFERLNITIDRGIYKKETH